MILLSRDGDKQDHNAIRGDTYDKILKNIEEATKDNICFYMAINQINIGDIEGVSKLAKKLDKVRAVSFNFHTPYKGTEALALNLEEKKNCCERIERLMKAGYPIFNLKSAFPYLVENTLDRKSVV